MTKIVEVWAKGYADRDGPSILRIADDADPAVEAAKALGPSAKVYSVRPAIRPVVEPVDEAYARTMSKHDNS